MKEHTKREKRKKCCNIEWTWMKNERSSITIQKQRGNFIITILIIIIMATIITVVVIVMITDICNSKRNNAFFEALKNSIVLFYSKMKHEYKLWILYIL